MKKKFKIGDWVIFIDKEDSASNLQKYGISLYGKIAKIIDIDKHNDECIIKFKEEINKDKKIFSYFCLTSQIKLDINPLKFKKWIKGE